jgi:hypothetical protein
MSVNSFQEVHLLKEKCTKTVEKSVEMEQKWIAGNTLSLDEENGLGKTCYYLGRRRGIQHGYGYEEWDVVTFLFKA